MKELQSVVTSPYDDNIFLTASVDDMYNGIKTINEYSCKQTKGNHVYTRPGNTRVNTSVWVCHLEVISVKVSLSTGFSKSLKILNVVTKTKKEV